MTRALDVLAHATAEHSVLADDHLVAGHDTDKVAPHFPGRMSEHFVAVGKLKTEMRVGKLFDHRTFDLDRVFAGAQRLVAPGRLGSIVRRAAVSASISTTFWPFCHPDLIPQGW